MFRPLLLLLIASASSAPQAGKPTDSDITYVKIQPITDQKHPVNTPYRQSRIENLSLTVPNVGTKRFTRRRFNRKDDKKEVLVNSEKSFNTPLVNDERNGFVNTPPLVLLNDERRDISANEKGINTPLSIGKAIKTEDDDIIRIEENVRDRPIKELELNNNPKEIKYQKTHVGENRGELDSGTNLDDERFQEPNSYDSDKGIESNLSKRSPDTTAELIALSEGRQLETLEIPTLEAKKFYLEDPENNSESTPPLILESNGRKVVVNEGSENTPENENEEETVNHDDFSETTDEVTEKNEDLEEIINETEKYDSRTQATPRFISKFNYFHNKEDEGSLVTNFIGRAFVGHRKFTSKCRCDKIWNCQKLQITVGRCPSEYFLCCF